MSSNKVVLDSSVIQGEHGSDKLSPGLLTNAFVSTINAAEVQSKLVAKGWHEEQAWEDCTGLVGEVLPFIIEQAKLAGNLVLATRSIGLSLGDRACLALALELKAVVYTADRSWKNLKLDLRINTIR